MKRLAGPAAAESLRWSSSETDQIFRRVGVAADTGPLKASLGSAELIYRPAVTGVDVKRRSFVAAVTGVAFAGCASRDSTAATTTQSSSVVYAGPGSRSHDIRVDNSRDHEVDVTIVVTHDDADVYRDEHTVDAGVERVVAGFGKESGTPERPTVMVSASDSTDQTASVEVTVSECLGNVVFYYEDGELQATYSIC